MKDVFKLELVLHVSDKGCCPCDAIWDLVNLFLPTLHIWGHQYLDIHILKSYINAWYSTVGTSRYKMLTLSMWLYLSINIWDLILVINFYLNFLLLTDVLLMSLIQICQWMTALGGLNLNWLYWRNERTWEDTKFSWDKVTEGKHGHWLSRCHYQLPHFYSSFIHLLDIYSVPAVCSAP